MQVTNSKRDKQAPDNKVQTLGTDTSIINLIADNRLSVLDKDEPLKKSVTM